EVAVKCLWEKRKGAEREAAIMEKVAGKYVPEIIDYNYSDSERAYFVSEYVEGAIDGAAWLKKHGKLSLKEGLHVGMQMAEALQSAHEKGIFHLDLKPANILLKRVDRGIEIKVIDFGLSKVANSLQEEAVTRQQTQLGLSVFGQGIMGTLEYAPPEQLGYGAEYGEPDAKSDVFSFGTTLYHLLTGESPRFPNPYKLPDNAELQRLLFDCVEPAPESRLDIREAAQRLRRLAESAAEKRAKENRKQDKKTKPQALKPPSKEVKTGEVFRDTLEDGSQCPEMVQITGGVFHMGDIQGNDDEKPVHEVALDDFAIGKYPVTVGEFRRFIEASAYQTEAEAGNGAWIGGGMKKDANWRNPYLEQDDNHPAVCISWNDAAAYCDWLRQQTGEDYRLPTEAEWEYACRAGSESVWFFGNDKKLLGDYAWHAKNSEEKTHPVGKKKANAYGLYELSGNVWEWVHDWFGSYPKEAQENPKGSESGFFRVIRGGSWDNSARYCRSAMRGGYVPGIRVGNLGFRLARTNPRPFYPFTLPEMVRLPSGTFQMGGSQGIGQDRKKPVHEVRLDSFSIGRYPVTFAEYDQFCEAAKREKPKDEGWGRDKRPVINVSWDDAAAYCEWLNTQTKEKYRLLTEAEWEYACRAGSETAYFFGDDEKRLGDYAWCRENSEGKTHPAGKKKPNAYGLHELLGNVWEWVHDWHGGYSGEAQTNPTGPETGSHRVMRGGCWGFDAGNCRSACRSYWFPDSRYRNRGFRLARTHPLPSDDFTLLPELDEAPDVQAEEGLPCKTLIRFSPTV
ncbi:MAG: SUMF1/EgtB/PvdO family nonheme iron enzyme, partial [Gammaproteobacteria bacterium]|nr:SUMF1/EgtB/PvdO family nonheme iron enzyme [Gammaproteobacteria bacterium]